MTRLQWKRTVYVKEADRPVWEAAEQLAQASGESLSAVLAEALRAHVEQQQGRPIRREPERVTAHVSMDGYREVRPAELEETRNRG